MPTQRITIAKIGGVAGDLILHRLQEWSAARLIDDPTEWSSEQWPPNVRKQVDHLADQLRAHSFLPPVIHFVEWIDMWTSGYEFPFWLTPPEGKLPYAVFADRVEIYGYALPDEDKLLGFLKKRRRHQFIETELYVRRLRETVEAWSPMVERGVVVVLRHVVGPLAMDEEIKASMGRVPEWLAEVEE